MNEVLFRVQTEYWVIWWICMDILKNQPLEPEKRWKIPGDLELQMEDHNPMNLLQWRVPESTHQQRFLMSETF